MKNFLLRWRHKRELKFVLLVVLSVSIIFFTYQFISYAKLDQFQVDEAAAHYRQHQQTKEIPIKGSGVGVSKALSGKKEPNAGVLPSTSKSVGKPLTGPVIGVAPEYQKYYSKQTTKFSCLSEKSRKISWDKVNDDYCDCPNDGSDEPSTSACMNGRFYCTKSSLSYAEYIPSSRVNDFICDCCDGSDEYLVPDLCPNTCR